ncbi:MAG TPA: DNA-binding domain-containing protein [Candidatus Binataceae bacterium]|nr:DNA-binding domain-containing protein [Candidatus Binataceae bacterium]
MAVRLKELERLLYRLITAPSGVAEGLAAERGLPPGGLDAIVRGDSRLSATQRVDIYASMYFNRLLDVLKEDFPATLKALGEVNFHNLITGYLLEYPPTEPSVHFCGRHLAAFLRDHPMRVKAPYVADLAALERALVKSFHARDAVALDAETMRSIPPAKWPAVRVGMHPAASILAVKWRVSGLLAAIAGNRKWKPSARGDVKVLVWRRNARVFHRELEPAEEHALAAAARGTTIARICDLIASSMRHGNSVAEANRLLARWIADGILVRMPNSRRRSVNRR